MTQFDWRRRKEHRHIRVFVDEIPKVAVDVNDLSTDVSISAADVNEKISIFNNSIYPKCEGVGKNTIGEWGHFLMQSRIEVDSAIAFLETALLNLRDASTQLEFAESRIRGVMPEFDAIDYNTFKDVYMSRYNLILDVSEMITDEE